VIVSNDTSNRHLARVQVMPLSSSIERIYPSETVVTLAGQRSKVMADQIMTADKRRLKTSMGRLGQSDMLAVERVIKLQLGLT
jgi:mRNA interferase MazF